MTEPMPLDKLLAEVTEEGHGYLRESLQDIILLAQKALETLDAGELPIAQASRLLSDAQAVVRNTDRLVMYQEIAEACGITEGDATRG